MTTPFSYPADAAALGEHATPSVNPHAPDLAETKPASDRPWRILGLLAMLGALVACGWHLQRGVSAPEEAQSEVVEQREATDADLTVEQFATAGATIGRVAVPGASRQPVTADGAVSAPVPADARSVVGLFAEDGSLRGMTLVGGATDGPVDPRAISPESTALTMLALFPGVITEDPDLLDQRLDALRQTPSFADLEREILKADALLEPNQELEVALARVINDWEPEVTRGEPCGPGADADAAGLGICVQVTDEGVTVTNRLDRWVAVFTPTGDLQSCGAVPPLASLDLTDVTPCLDSFSVAAPGPFGDDVATTEAQYEQTAVAGTVTVLNNYLIAANNLLTGSDPSIARLRNNRQAQDVDMLGLQLRAMLVGDDGLRQRAVIVGDDRQPATDRIGAWTVVAQRLLEGVIVRPPAGSYVDRPAAPAELARFIESAQRTAAWLNPDVRVGSWELPTNLTVETGAA